MTEKGGHLTLKPQHAVNPAGGPGKQDRQVPKILMDSPIPSLILFHSCFSFHLTSFPRFHCCCDPALFVCH